MDQRAQLSTDSLTQLLCAIVDTHHAQWAAKLAAKLARSVSGNGVTLALSILQSSAPRLFVAVIAHTYTRTHTYSCSSGREQ